MAEIMKKLLYASIFMVMALVLSACGSDEEEMTLLDENFEEVSIAGKDKPTVFFHFTSVGWQHCVSQLVQLQEHIGQMEDLEADIYALSNDSPENHKQLKEQAGFTFDFLSDPSMEVIEKADMKGEESSVRGFSVFDADGELITSEENDFWGDEIEETEEKIRKALEQ